jgi:hypothetical protein
MITSGLRDLFTLHGCEVVATASLDLSRIGWGDLPPDVLVIEGQSDRHEIAQRLRESHPGMALIVIDDTNMTVYPPGASGQSYRSPLTEERLLSAATAL